MPSYRRTGLAWHDIPAFRPHSIGTIRPNSGTRVLLPDLAARDALPEALGAETVSPVHSLEYCYMLMRSQHNPSPIHGPYLRNNLVSFLCVLLPRHLL